VNAYTPPDPLLDQRRRFLDHLCRGRRVSETATANTNADIVLSLQARSGAMVLKELPALISELAAGGILVVAETGDFQAGLRIELGQRFRHVTTLQQRSMQGSVISAERHAGSRILPLAEPVRAPPACLLHLASDSELPVLAPAFLESDGTASAVTLITPISIAAPSPTADTNARHRAVALVERCVAMDARLFRQQMDLHRLTQQFNDAPAPASVFEMPRTRHSWPLSENRNTQQGFYDHRVDDAVLREGDAGANFLDRFRLLGTEPDHNAAVAALNAAPRPILSDHPDVSIIIPVYGQLGYTLNCLDSLFAHTARATAEIIIVDDCSPDDSATVLESVAGISILRQPTNAGFIATCNTGAHQARGRYVLFLNNDTRVAPGWLDALVDSFTLFPNAGLVGSKMLYPDGSLQEAGGIIWRDGSCWNFGRNDDPNRPHYSHARQADYISGCSIMLPSWIFQALDGFDAHFAPAYCEDADLAMRVRQAGYEVWFQPQSRVVHYEGRTAGTDTGHGVKAYQRINSRKLLLRWHATLANHRTNGEAPMREFERTITRRALIIDASAPTPRQDAGSVTTTLTLGLFQSLGYKAHFVPQDNFLFQPDHCPALMRSGIEVAYAPYDISMDDYLRRHGASFDVVLVFRVTVLEQVLDSLRRYSPQASILFHTMDLHFLRMERQALLDNDAAALTEAAVLKTRELALIGKVDCTITHSTFEQKLLHEAAPLAPVVVWPFMFEFHGTTKSFAERRDICFLGGYRHAPNVDAVLFFAREVLPLIRHEEPAARFIIAGANPTPEVAALACDHIIVTGQIEDLRDVFDTSRVFACSLRIGAGTKGKVSTAMSYGLPVVSTTCGAEGMELQDGNNVLLADTAADFAAACLRLYRDPTLWQRLSDHGQALVRDHHSLAMGRRVLDGAIETALRHRLELG
jgi:GT2 family glycosyltransferase